MTQDKRKIDITEVLQFPKIVSGADPLIESAEIKAGQFLVDAFKDLLLDESPINQASDSNVTGLIRDNETQIRELRRKIRAYSAENRLLRLLMAARSGDLPTQAEWDSTLRAVKRGWVLCTAELSTLSSGSGRLSVKDE